MIAHIDALKSLLYEGLAGNRRERDRLRSILIAQP